MVGPDLVDQLRRQGAWPTSDVEHTLPGMHASELGEIDGKSAAVRTDEPLIGGCRDLEAHSPDISPFVLFSQRGPRTIVTSSHRSASSGQ